MDTNQHRQRRRRSGNDQRIITRQTRSTRLPLARPLSQITGNPLPSPIRFPTLLPARQVSPPRDHPPQLETTPISSVAQSISTAARTPSVDGRRSALNEPASPVPNPISPTTLRDTIPSPILQTDRRQISRITPRWIHGIIGRTTINGRPIPRKVDRNRLRPTLSSSSLPSLSPLSFVRSVSRNIVVLDGRTGIEQN